MMPHLDLFPFKRTALAACMLAATGANAESSKNNHDSLEEVVVHATFISETGQSGLKSDVPLRDVPLTISGYTNDFMNAIETSRVADLYSYMSGVQKSGATGYDFSIRGFGMTVNDRNAIQIDGLPGLSVRFGSPPTVNAERIEVVKGPAAVLYGQIQPGGFVNILTKKPEAERSTEIKFRAEGFYGDDADLSDTYGTTVSVDTTGSIDDQGVFLYRLVAEYQDNNTFRDKSFTESKYVVPSLTWNINDATKATVFAEYRKEDNALDNGIAIFDNDVSNAPSLTTRYQEPDDKQPEEGLVGGITLEHVFSDTLLWRLNYRYVDHEDSAKGYENLRFRDANTLRRRDRNQENERTYNFLDTTLSWDFSLSSIEHKLMIGINVGEETARFTRLNFDNNNPSLDIDLHNPIYGQGTPNEDRNVGDNDRERNFESKAIYIQDQLTLSEQWKAVVAARYEEFDSSEDFYQPVVPERTFVRTQSVDGDDISKMFGLIYQPNDTWSIYASFAESFDPPNWGREDANGNAITEPEKGTQYEFGVKSDFDWGTATLSYFTITREDVAQNTGLDAADGDDIWALSGQEKSDGIEVEINAQVNENWQLIFAYAYIDAVVDKDVNENIVGQRLRGSAENSASIWNRYQFNEAWGVGLGIKYTDEAYGTPYASNGDEASRMLLPDFTLVDLGVYYTSPAFNATLKIGNVFDETYYESGGSLGQNTVVSPGKPANAALSITMRF